MTNIQFIFAALSSIVGIACFVPYIRDIFRHKTQPHSYSWFIWTILQFTGVIAMFSAGAGAGISSLAIGTTLCGFIFLLSLRYGTHNIKTFDVICLIGALGALAIYFFLHNELLSVLMVVSVDIIGFLPTFRKAYEEPKTETVSTYVLSAVADALALGALTVFTVTTSVYLISLVVTNGLCAFIILIRRKQNNSSVLAGTSK